MHWWLRASIQCHLDFSCFSTSLRSVLCQLLPHPCSVTCTIFLPWQSLEVDKERAKVSASLQGGALDTFEDLGCPVTNPAQGNMTLISK